MSNIHWFPGHMNKALHQIEEKIKMVDVVVELLDARCPFSSINENLEALIKNKKRLLVLTKSDLADPELTIKLQKTLKSQFDLVISLNLNSSNATKEINKSINLLGKEKWEKDKNRGMKPQPLKVMILGIPNVGKSSLINKLANRKAAGVQNKPGYTVGEQWIKVNNDYFLLDTPGVLPMSYEDQQKAINLALVGSIKEDILPLHDLAVYLTNYLKDNYPLSLKERFGIENITSFKDVIQTICNKRGFVKGSEFDLEKAEYLLLKEFKNGLLGKISLEK